MADFTTYDRQLLEETPEKALSFLRAISTKVEIRAALHACGYTEEEQAEGWKLLLESTGYAPASPLVFTDDQKARAAITELDAWDDPGFRRIHAALGRLHAEQDAFLFEGLEAQQGAGSVVSVTTLLDRLDALEGSAARAATRKADKAALATLARRGIDGAIRKHLRDLVIVAQSAKAPAATPATNDGNDRRERSLVALRSWYRDWSETARAVIRRRDHLVMMGLSKRKRAKGPADGPSVPPPASPTTD